MDSDPLLTRALALPPRLQMTFAIRCARRISTLGVDPTTILAITGAALNLRGSHPLERLSFDEDLPDPPSPGAPLEDWAAMAARAVFAGTMAVRMSRPEFSAATRMVLHAIDTVAQQLGGSELWQSMEHDLTLLEEAPADSADPPLGELWSGSRPAWSLEP